MTHPPPAPDPPFPGDLPGLTTRALGGFPGEQPQGALALVIRPIVTQGAAALVRLPASELAASTMIHDLIGGYYEAIGGADWIAYTAEDERHFPDGLLPNLHADALARVLGFGFTGGDYAKGTLVFLGRRGAGNADVPQRIIDLAHVAGVLT
jgi:hypothetical protein